MPNESPSVRWAPWTWRWRTASRVPCTSTRVARGRRFRCHAGTVSDETRCRRTSGPALRPIVTIVQAAAASLVLVLLTWLPGRQVARAASVPSHVFVIMDENMLVNYAYSLPYIGSLLPLYGAAYNYSAVTHPSLPNYLAITSGQTLSTCGDCSGSVPQFSASNIFFQMQQAGISWGAYAEDLPSDLHEYSNCGQPGYIFPNCYDAKHFPVVYYSDIMTDPSAIAHIGDLSALQSDLAGPASDVPSFVWITPNLCNDMHSCAPQQGDAWLSTFLPQIINSKAFQDGGTILLTWDERGYSSHGLAAYPMPVTFAEAPQTSGGPVGMIVISSRLAAGTQWTQVLSHYSVLRALETAYGLPLLGDAATAPAWTDLPSLLQPSVATDGPASISETLGASAVGAGAAVTVSGTVTDANGNGVAGQTVDVAVGSASPVPATTGSDGTYSLQITAPASAGTYRVTVTVSGTSISRSTDLTVTAGAAASITETLGASSVGAGASVTVSGTVTDANGNGVAGQTVDVAVGSASPVPAATGSDGAYSLQIAAPASAGTYTVTVTVPGTAVEAQARLTVAEASPAGDLATAGPPVRTFAPQPASASSGGVAGPSAPANKPVLRTADAVTEIVNTGTDPVQLATTNRSVQFVLPQGSMPAGATVRISQLSPTAAPQAPARTDLASPVWTVNTGGIEPTQPVQAVFRYVLPAGTSPQELGLYTVQGGRWIFYTGGQIDPATGTLAAVLPHLSTWAVFADTLRFTDVPRTSWAFRSIEELTAAGIAAGYPNGTFEPNADVTRAEFLKLLLGAMRVPPKVSSAQPFSDVMGTDWFAGYVDAAASTGLLKGNEGLARPGATITRQEAAVLLVRAARQARLALPAGPSSLSAALEPSDESAIAPWAATDVNAALAAGLLHGFPDGTFRPGADLSRAEAAAMIEGLVSMRQTGSATGA